MLLGRRQQRGWLGLLRSWFYADETGPMLDHIRQKRSHRRFRPLVRPFLVPETLLRSVLGSSQLTADHHQRLNRIEEHLSQWPAPLNGSFRRSQAPEWRVLTIESESDTVHQLELRKVSFVALPRLCG